MDNSDTQSPVAPETAAATNSENPTSGANAPDTSPSPKVPAAEDAAPAAVVPSQAPKPHSNGGATLKPAAVAEGPELVARVEVLKDANGTFYTNLFAGRDLPQHRADDADQVRGAVDEFLTEHLAA